MIKPKKYKAKVIDRYEPNDEGKMLPHIEIVEGYLVPVSIQYDYSKILSGGVPKPKITWAIASTEAYTEDCCMSGMGMAIYKPHMFTSIFDLEEIEDV